MSDVVISGIDWGERERPRSPQVVEESVGGIRVLVAARNRLIHCGLRTMLSELAIADHVEMSGTTEEAAAALTRTMPDLLLLCMDTNTGECTRLVDLARATRAKVLLILRNNSAEEVERAAQLAADAYLVESAVHPSTLKAAVLRAASGRLFMPDSLARDLLATVRRSSEGPVSRLGVLLTPREKQTLRLLVDGMSNKQIAVRLGVTQHCVKRHVASVLAKLNCPNRTHAAAIAVREGLLVAG